MKYGYNTILLSIASFSFLLTWSFVKHCWTYGQSKFSLAFFCVEWSLELLMVWFVVVSPFFYCRWHAVASWTWDAQDETCGICRMAFDGCCPDCKLPGDDCPLSKSLPLFTRRPAIIFRFSCIFINPVTWVVIH